MEELFNNFANHVGHLISPSLGMEIQRYLRQKFNSSNQLISFFIM